MRPRRHLSLVGDVYIDDHHHYYHNVVIYDMLAPHQRCGPLPKIGFLTVIRNKKSSNRMAHRVAMTPRRHLGPFGDVCIDDDHHYYHNDKMYDMLAPHQRCDPLAKIGFLTVIRNKRHRIE